MLRRCALFMSVLASLHFAVAAVSAADTTPEQNKAIVRTTYAEVFNAGNLELLKTIVAADAVDHQLIPEKPEPQRILDNVAYFLQTFRVAFPDMKVEVLDMIAEGDRVVARCRMTGTHQGEFMGLAATGRTIAVEFIDIIRFADGRVVEHWGLSDDAALLRQLGADAK